MSTKQFSDLPIDVEEEENSTDKMNEKRRFACKQLNELRLFEWCYRKLHRRIRQQQGFYDRTSRTDLVMRRRRGGGLEDLLQEDIRAKQILLGTLVELSTVALEQVMSTTLGSLKISAHDKVMSGLVMKIAEARLKQLVCS